MLHVAPSSLGCDGMVHGGAGPATPCAADIKGLEGRSREARIADAILAMALAEAACLGGAQLLRIGVNVGADCEINIAKLDAALTMICDGTDVERIDIHLSLCPRVYFCRRCGLQYLSEISLQRCSQCRSKDYELVGGDDLELVFIEVDKA